MRIFATVLTLLICGTVAKAADKPAVRVVIEPTESGIVARYTFDKPLETFRVAYPSDEIRNNTWKVLTPGVNRDGTLFMPAKGTSLSSLDIEVQPWNEGTDAIYPCLFSVGERGLGFYAGYFIGEPSEFKTTIEVAPAEDRIVEGFPLGGNVWRVDELALGDPGHRYVYIGRRGDVVESRYARFVLPPGPAQGMIERIRTNFDGVLQFYTSKLARPLQQKPLVLLAANPNTRGAGFQGDTTAGPRSRSASLATSGKPSTKSPT